MNKVDRVIGAEIEALQRETFGYFEHEVNSVNGLVIDKTAEDSPASIAATGFALAAYPVGVERGFISRTAAVKRTLTTLPAIRGFIIISWTCKPGAARGSASCRL